MTGPVYQGCLKIQDTTLMIKVQVRQNESLEAALRRFKRQCNQSGLFAEMKERKFHTKTTIVRRLEEKARIQSIRRAERTRRQSRH